MLRTATGSLDWDALAGWDADKLGKWGFDDDWLDSVRRDLSNGIEILGAQKASGDFDFGGLPQDDRTPFQQMTFTLHDTQVGKIYEALKASKAMGAFVDSPNENSNGNALTRICETFLTGNGNG